jgi:lysophospholipid acyltransferase (LPLAT)-like uncharacterized protein
LVFREKLLPLFVFAFYKLLTRTWRIEVVENPEMVDRLQRKASIIMAIWHGDELASISLSSRYKLCTMTSTSKDGQLMDSVLRRLGFETSRGSSTRGGVSGLKGLLRLAKSGLNPVFAVDGPKGPYRQAKSGVFEVSKILGLPIFPLAVYAKNRFVFKKSWNKAYLPLPFSRVVFVWGQSLPIVSRDQDPRSAELSALLRERLLFAESQAQRVI